MSLNNRCILIYDFETTGKNPQTAQLTQIAAVALDGFTLDVKPNGFFNSEIKPIFDLKVCAELGLAMEEEALKVTRKTREQLEKAPSLKVVWEDWVTFIKKFNPGKSTYTAPVRAGFNIINYDDVITNRMCTQFGNVDKEGRQNLFNQVNKIDVMDLCFNWFEDVPEVTKINLQYMREYLGFPQKSMDNAHDALQDVKDTANILIKFMKFQRSQARKTKFAGAFSNGEFYVT